MENPILKIILFNDHIDNDIHFELQCTNCSIIITKGISGNFLSIENINKTLIKHLKQNCKKLRLSTKCVTTCADCGIEIFRQPYLNNLQKLEEKVLTIHQNKHIC